MLRNGILIPPFRSFFILLNRVHLIICASTASFNVSSATSALMLTTAVLFHGWPSHASTPASASNAFFTRASQCPHHSFDIHCLYHRYSLHIYIIFDSHFLHFFETVSFFICCLPNWPGVFCPHPNCTCIFFSPPLLAAFSALPHRMILRCIVHLNDSAAARSSLRRSWISSSLQRRTSDLISIQR